MHRQAILLLVVESGTRKLRKVVESRTKFLFDVKRVLDPGHSGMPTVRTAKHLLLQSTTKSVESGTYDVICQFCTVKGMVVESEVLKAQSCALSKLGLPMHSNERSKLERNIQTFNLTASFFYRKLYYLCDPERLEKYFGYDNEHDDTEEAKLNSILCDVDLTYGYSLTSLRIPNATTGRVLYYLATGGPRASGLFGQVKIFAFDRGTDVTDDIIHRFKFLKTITGTHFNSGFGTTILGADLNGDGYDELLVGEPYRMVSSGRLENVLLLNVGFQTTE